MSSQLRSRNCVSSVSCCLKGWRKGKQHGYAIVYGANSTKNKNVVLTQWKLGQLLEGSTFDYSFRLWRVFKQVHSGKPIRDTGELFDVSRF